jgi:hypothetical protein
MRGMTLELDKVTIETFAPHIGTSFSLEEGNAEHVLVLESIAPARHDSPGRRASFSLYFRLDAGGTLPQRTWELTHESLGTFPLFLVPVSEPGKGVRYEAVFN